MSELAFKAGDRVRVRADLEPSKLRDVFPSFTKDMDESVGRCYTVKSVEIAGSVSLVGTDFEYAPEWLEHVAIPTPVPATA